MPMGRLATVQVTRDSGQTTIHLEGVEQILAIQTTMCSEEILVLVDPLCFVTTVRNQDTQRIDVTNFMDTHLIQGFKREKTQVGNGPSSSDNSDNMLNEAVNLADSGASHHMTYDKTTLTNIKSLPYPFLISLPNGYKVKVTEIGDVCLNPTLTLRKGPSLKSPLELGKAKNDLYFLCNKCHNCCPSAENKPPRLPHFNCHLVPSLDIIYKSSNSKVYTSSSMTTVGPLRHNC
ncbi:hypothetical protein KY290_025667 [Solanum tuberosum]|uniref:Retrovirus-related Pol polyprotein from transposon TNT 1-94-like beta-barrel domain-containing protein n=1 Tax=Solanum tuberosum TaxID=4113 RepID=A0ABQ7UU91_SOLTU|nr:hypothetical protein KY285_024485 [Solanum tuberosum]KAH0755397.1 hypothetical protein KY290_025667 [Solanum tuberosum]